MSVRLRATFFLSGGNHHRDFNVFIEARTSQERNATKCFEPHGHLYQTQGHIEHTKTPWTRQHCSLQ